MSAASDGPLVLSGGGSTMVATDALLTDARHLDALARQSSGWASRLNRALAACDTTPALTARGSPESWAHGAQLTMRKVHERSADLVGKLHQAAEDYGAAERRATHATEGLGALVGWALGSAVGWGASLAALVLLSPAALLSLAGAAIVGKNAIERVVSRLPELRGLPDGLVNSLADSRVICNPRFVAMLRVVVSSVDNVELGLMHVPYLAASLADDDATGWFGLKGAALEVVAFAGLLDRRHFEKLPVTVAEVDRSRVRAPSGFADLASRVPPSAAGGPQVRIEKYSRAGGAASWVVYVGGTIAQGVDEEAEPWDNNSNVRGVGELDPASVRATEQAMHDAGIARDDRVQLVGYSQGGLVATSVARSGDFNSVGLLTFGSPTGQMPVPDSMTNVGVEIAEDPIPALGGEPATPEHGGLERTIVRRSIYSHSEPPAGEMLPAHDIAGYRDTAAMMDSSTDPRLLKLRSVLDSITAGADAVRGPAADTDTAGGLAEVTLWRAQRVFPADSAGTARPAESAERTGSAGHADSAGSGEPARQATGTAGGRTVR